MDFDFNSIADVVTNVGLQIITKGLAAVLFWIIGRWLIGVAGKLVSAALGRQKFDETLKRYLLSVLDILLNIILIVAIFGYLGVETATFAAVLASAGVAIGLAWSGLLSNFAAGVFMVILRPFGVGDFVKAGGVTGTVEEVGLFVTTINTMDNIHTIVGNNKIFSDTIQNFTANPYRRVELFAQLSHDTDHDEAIRILKERLKTIPNVSVDLEPFVDIVEFNLAGPVLAVRPYCHNDYYWDVYFATNRAIREEFGKAGFSVPEKRYTVNGLPFSEIPKG